MRHPPIPVDVDHGARPVRQHGGSRDVASRHGTVPTAPTPGLSGARPQVRTPPQDAGRLEDDESTGSAPREGDDWDADADARKAGCCAACLVM